MALFQAVQNGEVVNNGANSAKVQEEKKTSNGMDKDAFLQLLVAQMKYQDPLEPTSNTEYITQYAQFSQVQYLQNLSGSYDMQRANDLVGQYVYVKTGEGLEFGKVDYVGYEGSKVHVFIDEKQYDLDDIDSVVDAGYHEAMAMAQDIADRLNNLPVLDSVGLEDIEEITEIASTYQDMSSYQKGFLGDQMIQSIEAYLNKAIEVSNEAAEFDAARKALIDALGGTSAAGQADSTADDTKGTGQSGTTTANTDPQAAQGAQDPATQSTQSTQVTQ